jgi:hypothetical protein
MGEIATANLGSKGMKSESSGEALSLGRTWTVSIFDLFLVFPYICNSIRL